jgi:acetyltransferase-like isoleucine patch superfamily enzyme
MISPASTRFQLPNLKQIKHLTAIYFWRQVKTIPFFRDIISYVYYFFNKNKRIIFGKSNVIQIELDGSFPFLRNVIFEIIGDSNAIVLKSGVRLENTRIKIQGLQNQLIIDEDCRIGGGSLWITGHDCQLIIGKNTTIVEATIGAEGPKTSVTIGEDCMFAHGIDIRSGDSHSIIDLASNERLNHAQDINIGNHVWIAAKCHVLKGVSIGSNSIVGAGSIVTKDVPENCIVAGVPAQVKKTKVTWLR